MDSSKHWMKSTLLPMSEHRQAKVYDVSVLEGAGASQQCSSSRSRGKQLKQVLKPLVRLKDAFVELMVSESTPEGRSSAAYCSMGVVMGPVDLGM